MSATTVAYKPYSGRIEDAAHKLYHGSVDLHLETCGLERRLWEEPAARDIIASHLPMIRESIARQQRALADIEATLTTVEEQQADAKEDHSRAAA